MKHTTQNIGAANHLNQRFNNDVIKPAPACKASTTDKYDTEPFILSKNGASNYEELEKAINISRYHICAMVNRGEFPAHTYTNKAKKYWSNKVVQAWLDDRNS